MVAPTKALWDVLARFMLVNLKQKKTKLCSKSGTEITENVDGWVHSPVVFILGMFEATNITVVKASQKCKVFHGQHI